MRTRRWFITINKGADSWHEFRDVINNQSRCKYAYCLHDKDNEEQEHIHIVIAFDNARTFETMQNMFKGAHIEECKYFNKSIRYLVHRDDVSKYQYDLDEIITNYTSDEINSLIDNDEFIKLDTETILEMIINGEVYNYTTACNVFGIQQVRNYKNIIDELLKEHKREMGRFEEIAQLLSRIRELDTELAVYREFFGNIREKERLKELYEQ